MNIPKESQLTLKCTMEEFNDICESRHLGNPESKAAFQVVKQRLNLKQAAVLQYVRECGERGATCDEIALHFETNPNNVSGRLSELKRDGKIVKCGRRMTRSGCYAAVMKAI